MRFCKDPGEVKSAGSDHLRERKSHTTHLQIFLVLGFVACLGLFPGCESWEATSVMLLVIVDDEPEIAGDNGY